MIVEKFILPTSITIIYWKIHFASICIYRYTTTLVFQNLLHVAYFIWFMGDIKWYDT